MNLTILVPGRLPRTAKPFVGTCPNCGAVVECPAADAKMVGIRTERQGKMVQVIMCPTGGCNDVIDLTEKA